MRIYGANWKETQQAVYRQTKVNGNSTRKVLYVYHMWRQHAYEQNKTQKITRENKKTKS